VNVEPPRLLAARSQYGYTQRPSEALQGEPEAVSVDEQARLTREAQQAARERERTLIAECSAAIGRELDRLASLPDLGVSSSVRVIRRQLAQMAQRRGRR